MNWRHQKDIVKLTDFYLYMPINFATYFTFNTEIYLKLCQQIYDSYMPINVATYLTINTEIYIKLETMSTALWLSYWKKSNWLSFLIFWVTPNFTVMTLRRKYSSTLSRRAKVFFRRGTRMSKILVRTSLCGGHDLTHVLTNLLINGVE